MGSVVAGGVDGADDKIGPPHGIGSILPSPLYAGERVRVRGGFEI
jgi:hypothetical protein